MPSHLAIPLSRLAVFGDRLCLRDPRGRGPNPAILERWGVGGRPELLVQGPFTVLQRFDISPEEGRAFVETSRDENPIHTQDTVVSGAMTASRLLLLPEVLVPGLAVRSARVKFRAFSRYDRPTVNRFHFLPGADGGLKVDLEVLQQGVKVADGTIQAALRPEATPARPAGASAEVLGRWLWSLRMSPQGTLALLGSGYPRAFLASLPPGEMVRMGGAGGLLNALDFEFPELGVPGLGPEPPPTVEVEQTRPRNAFRKVLARVAQGMVTYVRGSATVLLDILGRSPGSEATSPA
jgi:hypothetical protein